MKIINHQTERSYELLSTNYELIGIGCIPNGMLIFLARGYVATN
jgi:hypothetical protein